MKRIIIRHHPDAVDELVKALVEALGTADAWCEIPTSELNMTGETVEDSN